MHGHEHYENEEDEMIDKTRMLLDYYKYATTKGRIEDADIVANDKNVSCGDVVEIYLKVDENGKIVDAKFTGQGCIISQASAAMLTEMLIGKTVEEAAKMDKKELLDAIGIPLGPVRIKCALLSFKVMKKGVLEYLAKREIQD